MKELLKDIYFKIALSKIRKLEIIYEDFIFIFVFAGIGDLCYSFAFLDELKKRTGKRIMVFTKEYLVNVVSYYSAVDEIRILKRWDLKLAKSFFDNRKNWKYFNDGVNDSPIYNFSHWNRFGWEILRLPNVNYLDVERYILYNYDEKTEISYPIIPNMNLEKYNFMNFDKTIIINPHSNFLKAYDYGIFERTADTLLASGFDVYTNAMKGHDILKGTRRLDCSLEDLYVLSKRVKLIISIRSGIMDFMVNSGGKFIVLYPDKTPWDRIFRQSYTLEAWRAKSEIHECYLGEEQKIKIKIQELVL